ncbi:MAG: autotransporter domain-containing protein [Planctomycetaceae bacterium]|nr:autotransporter domain-containing protein [Planctomycetaceae bacterium]
MKINSRKSKYAILVLVTLFVATYTAGVMAQNIYVGGATPSVTITTSSTDNIVFMSDGATLIVSPSPAPPYSLTWGGSILMREDGIINVNRGGSPAGDYIFILNGELNGEGNFTKTGIGTFVLNNVSDLEGKTIIEGGTFKLGASGELSEKTVVELANGTTLDIFGATKPNQVIASLAGEGTVNFGASQTLSIGGNNEDTTFSGILTGGNSTLEKVGSGTLFINTPVYYSFAGKILISEGTLGGSGFLDKVEIDTNAVLAPGTGSSFSETINIKDLTLDGTLLIRVDDQGDTDKVIGHTVVIGTNANLLIDAKPGDYSVLREYDNYIIGGAPVYGNFDLDIIQKFLDINWKNGIHIQVFTIGRKLAYFTDPAFAQTYNRQEVGKVLDNVSSARLWDIMAQISDKIEGGAANYDLIQNAYDQMSGDLRANSMMLGQWQTSRYGLNHLDLTNCGVSQGNKLWLEIVHQTTNFDDDGNSGGYGISRSGFLVGSEERRVDTVFGFFVGYSYPFLYDHGDKVEAGDLQFGFYGGSKVNDRLETKLFVGYGHQGYKSKRFIDNPLLVDTRERINGKYSGDSMSMSLELGLPLSSGMFCLRPVLALDSDLTWQYGFAETGNTGLELWYDRSFMDRSFLRTGLTVQLGSVDHCDTLAFQGRAYYGHQAFNNSSPVSRNRFVTEPVTNPMRIYGVDPGRDYVNLGLGLCWNIDAHRSFYGDYDFNAFSKSTAHWGTFGFMQKW